MTFGVKRRSLSYRRHRPDDGAMSLREHLREFRKRAGIAAGAVVLAGIFGFIASDSVIAAAAHPLLELHNGNEAGLNFTRVGEAFDLRFKIATTAGIVLAAPVWLFQLWSFLVPGLTKRERRIGMLFVGLAVPLFFSGAAFGWLIVPHIVVLLASFAPAGSTTLLTAIQYYDFLLKFVLAVGIAFVSPLVIIALNAVGVLSARSIIRGWRAALVIIIIFSAAVTPASDMLSMGLVALPLCVLYVGAAAWAAVHDRRLARRAAKVLTV
ncbi:twin-arginine translocase subunit TatC [Microbacterium testaceum]|uniref:twin-arginine translocase subunit TatC n=1 Tax=Microbacterium testaceum TaxID=2033 RepID=UPI002AC58AF0|nr:twin-arginine translocase subunit TatC [Microbacterium testaceum]MDZ5146126.1 twin-arginine translocase subunit TatC [Microbacterium testaceum]